MSKIHLIIRVPLEQKCKVFMKKNPIEGLVKYDD